MGAGMLLRVFVEVEQHLLPIVVVLRQFRLGQITCRTFCLL